ncbi:MAG: hypothetical protein MI919_30425, partial [Holophagales bacterium]|nr:hypothetical protein [Holophagales bacterium]
MACSARGITGLLSLILALAPAGAVEASTLHFEPSAAGYVHEIFDLEDGLPSAGLTQALQTRDGYLWLATFDGLVRYDGARFEIFRSDEYPALRSNRVGLLEEDRHGTLWIWMDQGLIVRYRDGRFTACGPIADGISCALPNTEARGFSLHEDPEGAIWLFWQGQVFRTDSVSSAPRKIGELPVVERILEVVSDARGRLWIVTVDRLWVGRWKGSERPGFRQVDRGVEDLGVDEQGTVWISRKEEIGRLDETGYTIVHE